MFNNWNFSIFINSKIREASKNLIKVLAIFHLFDGTQGFNGGILRAVGAQLYASIALFVGFCVVGTPIGISLLLKTNLKVYGNIFKNQSNYSKISS